jgi:hypothetical protein
MNCTECTEEIRRGDEYVAIGRTTERVGRFGSVKVTDAELQATYHPQCAPQQARA